MVLISVVFYLVGMSTVGWAVDDEKVFHVGLWDACQCSVDISSPCKYISKFSLMMTQCEREKQCNFVVVNQQLIHVIVLKSTYQIGLELTLCMKCTN